MASTKREAFAKILPEKWKVKPIDMAKYGKRDITVPDMKTDTMLIISGLLQRINKQIEQFDRWSLLFIDMGLIDPVDLEPMINKINRSVKKIADKANRGLETDFVNSLVDLYGTMTDGLNDIARVYKSALSDLESTENSFCQRRKSEDNCKTAFFNAAPGTLLARAGTPKINSCDWKHRSILGIKLSPQCVVSKSYIDNVVRPMRDGQYSQILGDTDGRAISDFITRPVISTLYT